MYSYPITGFPNHKVSTDSLSLAIRSSAIVTALDYINTDPSNCDIYFKASLSDGDKTLLDGIVAVHSGQSLDPDPTLVKIDTDYSAGAPVLLTTKADWQRYTVITHDWFKRDTWYQKANYTGNCVLTNESGNQVYANNIPWWIDSYHSKLCDEQYLKGSGGVSLRAKVIYGGVTGVEQDPHYGSGGDYTIDYSGGKVVFNAPLSGDPVVTASFHYSPEAAGRSTFTIKPPSGYIYQIEGSKIVFSEDVVATDTLRFAAYGYVQSFAPYLTGAPYYYPLNTMIPLGNDSVAKGFEDLLAWACVPTENLPALGGSGWRGATPSIQLVWEYPTLTNLDASKGMEIRISCDHDIPWQGRTAKATFRGSIKPV